MLFSELGWSNKPGGYESGKLTKRMHELSIGSFFHNALSFLINSDHHGGTGRWNSFLNNAHPSLTHLLSFEKPTVGVSPVHVIPSNTSVSRLQVCPSEGGIFQVPVSASGRGLASVPVILIKGDITEHVSPGEEALYTTTRNF